MIKQIKWFDRKFNFDFPVELFPNIVERLGGTPARLEEKFRMLPSTILTRKSGSVWSIQEHAGHLIVLDELHYGRLIDYKNGETKLRPADLLNTKTNEENFNIKNPDEILKEFRSLRMKFVAELNNINEVQAAAVAEHPRLKQQMRLIDMLYFIAEHDDHHLAAMERLANSF